MYCIRMSQYLQEELYSEQYMCALCSVAVPVLGACVVFTYTRVLRRYAQHTEGCTSIALVLYVYLLPSLEEAEASLSN